MIHSLRKKIAAAKAANGRVDIENPPGTQGGGGPPPPYSGGRKRRCLNPISSVYPARQRAYGSRARLAAPGFPPDWAQIPAEPRPLPCADRGRGQESCSATSAPRSIIPSTMGSGGSRIVEMDVDFPSVRFRRFLAEGQTEALADRGRDRFQGDDTALDDLAFASRPVTSIRPEARRAQPEFATSRSTAWRSSTSAKASRSAGVARPAARSSAGPTDAASIALENTEISAG